MSQPWLPETKAHEDQVFIRLNKWDRGLIRFATGVTLKFKGDHVNLRLIDEICSRRNHACDQLYREIRLQEQEGSNSPNRKGRKVYIRKSKASDCTFLDKTVQVRLPDAEGEDGQIVQGHDCTLLTDGIRTSTVYMEMTEANLNYIYQYVSVSACKGRSWRKRARSSSQPAFDDTADVLDAGVEQSDN
jgi:hypothetical protein